MEENKLFPASEGLTNLTREIDAAIELLRDFMPSQQALEKRNQPPNALLDQCLALCTQQQVANPEPIRTVHHFACTGGTLISKCIAAMPNVQLLSEVAPLSTILDGSGSRFAPTDMLTLLRQSTKGVNSRLLANLFLDNLEVVYGETWKLGQRLVVRDHPHSHYCVASAISEQPNLREMISSRLPVLSVVTVRHPIDSYLSLKSVGWVTFNPGTLDEYCRRYVAFLHAYQDVPVLRYEEFVAAPSDVMRTICDILQLPFSPDFIDLFDVFKLTGDSGRSGNVIKARERRPIDDSLADEMRASSNYQTLQRILQYDEH